MKSYCSEKLEAVHSDIRGPLYLKAMEMEKAGADYIAPNVCDLKNILLGEDL